MEKKSNRLFWVLVLLIILILANLVISFIILSNTLVIAPFVLSPSGVGRGGSLQGFPSGPSADEEPLICDGTCCDCLCQPDCGDGIVQLSGLGAGCSVPCQDESCDDGNNQSGDGCSSDCFFVESGWQCETGNVVNFSSFGCDYSVGPSVCTPI